jgi:hypothetical protein
MAEAVHHLPSKPKALNSNPSTTKKKQTNKKPMISQHYLITLYSSIT